MKEVWLWPLSIFLGIFTWYYVNITSSLEVEREFVIPIKYVNMPPIEHYKIQPENPKVKVRVEGPRRIFIKTNAEKNIIATVDLINVHKGSTVYDVKVLSEDLEVKSQEPQKLKVVNHEMGEKTVPVKLEVIGQVPDGFINEEPKIEPSSVRVIAPEEMLKEISHCRLDVNLNNLKNSISEPRKVIVIDNAGVNNDELVKIKGGYQKDDEVLLNIVVREGYPEKEYAPKIEFLNKVPEGRVLKKCFTNPEKIIVTGSRSILATTDDIFMEPVDLSNIYNSSSFHVKLRCPKGLKIVGPDTVLLNIVYEVATLTKTFDNLPIEYLVNSNQKYETDVSSYSVTVDGNYDVVNSIKESEFKNIINLKSLSSGTHEIPIEVPYGLPNELATIKIEPEKTNIKLEIQEDVPTKETTSTNASATINTANKLSSDTVEVISEQTIKSNSSETQILEKDNK